MWPEPDDDNFYIRMYTDGSFGRVRALETIETFYRWFGNETPTWYIVGQPDLLMWSEPDGGRIMPLNVAASVLANRAFLSSAPLKLPSLDSIYGPVLFTGKIEMGYASAVKVQSLSLENEARVGVYCKLANDELMKLEQN